MSRRLALRSPRVPTLIAMRALCACVLLAACSANDAGVTPPIVPPNAVATQLALLAPSSGPLLRRALDSSATTLKVQLRDSANAPARIANRSITVTLAAGPTGQPSGIVVSRGATATTDSTGTADFASLVLRGVAGTGTLVVTASGLPPVTVPLTLIPGRPSPQGSAVAVDLDSIPVGAVGHVTVVPLDADGNKLGPARVVSASFAGDSVAAGVGPFSYLTNDSSYRATITARAVIAARALQVVVDSLPLSTKPMVSVVAAPTRVATRLILSTLPGDTTGGGFRIGSNASWPSVEIQAVDAAGAAVPQAGISVSTSATLSGGGSWPVSITGGAARSTDASGHVSFPLLTLTGAPTAGRLTWSATGLTGVSIPVRLVTGVVGAAQSIVMLSSGTVLKDSTVTAIVIPRDVAGTALGAGQTVSLALSGGTSSATISAVTYQASDTSYRATLTGVTPGTATTLVATVNGTALTARPTLTVVARVATKLILSALPGDTTGGGFRIGSNASWPTIELQAVDASGVAVAQAGISVATTATLTGGASWPVTIAGGGVRTTDAAGHVSLSGLILTGAPNTGRLTWSASGLTSVSVPVRLVAGVVSASQSTVTLTSATVLKDSSVTAIIVPRDVAGTALGSGQTVSLAVSGGTSTVTQSAVTYQGSDSSYRVVLTGVNPGTATTLTATVNATVLTSKPTLTVTVPFSGSGALKITVLPGDTIAGFTPRSGFFWPSMTVQIVDAGGVPVHQSGIAITTKATTTAGVVLTDATIANGGPISTDANGQAVFPSIALTTRVGLQRLRFDAAGLSSTSMPVNIKSGAINATTSTMTVTNTSVAVDGTVTIIVVPKDLYGNPHGGGSGMALTASTGAGVSTGLFGGLGYVDADSSYRVVFTGKTVGTPTTISANLNGTIINATVQITVKP